MSHFRFIHCSDLHLDTPFVGISSIHPSLAERLRQATESAFSNIVELAIEKQVDAVLIAGDVYNDLDKSLQAQLKFRDYLKKLFEAGIPSFIVHGNHDPLDSWSASLEWPLGVKIFSGNQVEQVPVLRDGNIIAQIYGISYPKKEVTENLALLFNREQSSGFAVGLLHANVGNNPNHGASSPCKVEDLVTSKMDYWALGHIHKRQILRDMEPGVVYCGNPQARSFKEQGEKGCYLVTLDENLPPKLEFFPSDSVRFHTEQIDISKCAHLDDLLTLIQAQCDEKYSQIGERDLFMRFNLEGSTALNSELRKGGTLEDLTEKIIDYYKNLKPGIWIELKLDTRGTYDLNLLRQRNDFVSDVVSLYDELESGKDLSQLRETLEPLFHNWKGQKNLETLTDSDLLELLRTARDITLEQLLNEE